MDFTNRSIQRRRWRSKHGIRTNRPSFADLAAFLRVVVARFAERNNPSSLFFSRFLPLLFSHPLTAEFRTRWNKKQRTSVVIIRICPTCSCSGTQNSKSRATHRRPLNATQATRMRAATMIESGRIPAAPSPSSSSSCSPTPASPSHSDPAPLRSKSRPNSSVHGAPRPRRITARANSQLLEHERIEPDAKRAP